jgi:RNA polymerase sigma-70 factor (ECF subfamily)
MRLYLYASVRNRSLNALRNQCAEVSMRERLASEARPERVDDTAPSALGEVEAQELSDAVARVVATMPPRCREVFTLLRYQHLSYIEVAQVLGISPKTVEIHMTRALAILRARLAPWLHP